MPSSDEGRRTGTDETGAAKQQFGATHPVFLVDTLPTGSRATLDGEEARHAATVRRLRVGEHLILSDGDGGMAECVIEAVQPGRDATLQLSIQRHHTEPPPQLRVTVAQALVKGDRGELAVELATEAGADAIIPWRATRSIARWEDGPRGQKALARWRATARAAAKQARRNRVPHLSEPHTTTQLTHRITTATATLVLENAVSQRLTDIDLPTVGELILIVGPEGGITDEELRTFTTAGAHTIRLGPTVLRTSTAAAVALGALGPLTTRWR